MSKVISEKTSVANEKLKCCICGEPIDDWGNNPYPIAKLEPFKIECCGTCNRLYVLPIRYDLNSLRRFVESNLPGYHFEDILLNEIGGSGD